MVKSVSIFAFSFYTFALALPQQRPGEREYRGSVACSEVCGGVFICSRLDPKAGICSASTQVFNARYQKCQCGEANQVFDSWPLKPKMKLQPEFHYCSRTVCSALDVKACASETTESSSCKELKAAHAAERAACACSPVQRRDAQRPEATILPFYSESGVLHVQPITKTTKRAEATIMPFGDMLPPRETGVAHILPITTTKKAEVSIMPWTPEATILPYDED